MKQWLTVQEAAVLVGKHTRAIYRWISAGKLEATCDADGRPMVEADQVVRVDSQTRPGRPRIVRNAP